MEPSFWRGKRVLVTGHTGFKGSWLSLWLARQGALVSGYALPPPTTPSLHEAAHVGDLVQGVIGDIRDAAALSACMLRQQPEVIFHLAAQALVRRSYADPVSTYQTNVMGTVHVLEAARHTPSVRVIVNVTSDKCYSNREVIWGYRETDPVGGHDPYSSSKGCAELVAAAYSRSFFQDSAVRLGSVRAGNVIGGGDWADDRLVPDCFRALMSGTPIEVRNPSSVRPWQHVLEPLAGYLLFAEHLWERTRPLPPALNFGPSEADVRPVGEIVEGILRRWPQSGNSPAEWRHQKCQPLHEATLLTLDSTLARHTLGWKPRLTLDDALDLTTDWYRRFHQGEPMQHLTIRQIEAYQARGTIKTA